MKTLLKVQASIAADYLPQPSSERNNSKKRKKVQHAFADPLLVNLFANELNLYEGIEDAAMMSVARLKLWSATV